MEKLLTHRPANRDDWKLLLKWRNDPLTRENSYSHEEIGTDAHRSWLDRKLADPDCILKIVFLEDTPVGVLRLDRSGTDAEISYTVAPEARGKGCGTAIIALAEQIAPADITRLTASVLSGNPASLRCFERNGFSSVRNADSVFFHKTIR